MAGMTERRGPDPRDSFWTWRQLMYRFLERLTPEDVGAIAALVQMEMLEAGYASVGEFHYLHHQPDGTFHDNPAEMCGRIAEAATQSGIGLTLLPVLYERGGCDGRPLTDGQKRFGNSPEQFARLLDRAVSFVNDGPDDWVLGVAPHSLRAVSAGALDIVTALRPAEPVHIHIAEQTAEVDEVVAVYKKRPVEWLLENNSVDNRWCLVHATHMTPEETESLAKTGAAAGLCPITEANLGDGNFDGGRFLTSGGTFGIGSDSNIRISLSEELRLLEYTQRLRDRSRAVLATPDRSCGRVLFEGAAIGGAQAVARKAGTIETGRLADLVALDATAIDIEGKHGDTILDAFVFTGSDTMVRDVWSAGRHVVADGRHIRRDEIIGRYRKTQKRLSEDF